MRTTVATLALSAACGGQKDTKNEPAGSAATVVTPTAPEAAKPPTPVAPAPAGPPVDVTGRQLYEDYKGNPDDADAKYLHKMLRVHCIVGGSHGTTYLEIEVASGRDHIAAWFTDESASAMRQLRHYQEVFIRCRGGGMLDVPQLKDCVLEQVVRDPAAPETTRPPVPVAQAPAVPPIGVTAKQLFDDYTASEAKADAKYKGKMLRVTGKIDVVSGDHANFSTYDLSAGPQAYFVDRRVPGSMKEDQKITVECRCEGFIAPTVPVPKLVDCVLK